MIWRTRYRWARFRRFRGFHTPAVFQKMAPFFLDDSKESPISMPVLHLCCLSLFCYHNNEMRPGGMVRILLLLLVAVVAAIAVRQSVHRRS